MGIRSVPELPQLGGAAVGGRRRDSHVGDLRRLVGLLARFGKVFGKVVIHGLSRSPLSGLRVAHRSVVIGHFRRKLLILWDEDSVTGVPAREDVAPSNRCVTLTHVEQRREVALPTRVGAFVELPLELPRFGFVSFFSADEKGSVPFRAPLGPVGLFHPPTSCRFIPALSLLPL